MATTKRIETQAGSFLADCDSEGRVTSGHHRISAALARGVPLFMVTYEALEPDIAAIMGRNIPETK